MYNNQSQSIVNSHSQNDHTSHVKTDRMNMHHDTKSRPSAPRSNCACYGIREVRLRKRLIYHRISHTHKDTRCSILTYQGLLFRPTLAASRQDGASKVTAERAGLPKRKRLQQRRGWPFFSLCNVGSSHERRQLACCSALLVTSLTERHHDWLCCFVTDLKDLRCCAGRRLFR